MGEKAKGPRCAVIVGPYTAGKTTLMEAMLFAAGAIQRKGTVPTGTTLGDASPEARARQMTTEPNVAHFSYLDDPWCVIDCPGSVELMQDARSVLMIADVAVVVVEPDVSKAAMVAPLLRHLDEYAIPHILFFNKIDKAQVRVAELLSAYQAASPRPLVLRQVPIRQGDQIVGAVDLVSERAWAYNENKPSNLIPMPDSLKPREVEARQGLLETLADFDDKLMEQLLEEKTPASAEVYQQLAKDLQQDLIVPVFLGSAEHGNGIVRLLKALRHEAPSAAETAKRLGIDKGKGATLTVARTFYQAHTGKMSLARLWHGELKEGQALGGERPAGLFHLKGPEAVKITKAAAGDVVGLSRMEKLLAGQRLDEGGEVSVEELWPQVPQPIYALALKPQNRADDVKLSGAIGKLIEEDPSLKLEHDQALHQMLLWGQGEIHLQVAVDRLKHKFNVAVETQKPITPYKETIRKSVEQHSRFKRQSGGHGQFADIKVQIRPLPRGAGFQFEDAVVGGAVPRQFIPSVEDGVRDSLAQGPLGFPVVDLAVKLHDGQFHSVDSSDMAFKTAGRQAMTEGLPLCEPVLLEPICEVTVYVPNEAMSRVNGLISSRRGQILGFEERPGWPGWDQIKCHLPQSEMSDLIIELRSLTQGAASFTWRFDHLQELVGRAADKVREQRQAAG